MDSSKRKSMIELDDDIEELNFKRELGSSQVYQKNVNKTVNKLDSYLESVVAENANLKKKNRVLKMKQDIQMLECVQLRERLSKLAHLNRRLQESNTIQLNDLNDKGQQFYEIIKKYQRIIKGLKAKIQNYEKTVMKLRERKQMKKKSSRSVPPYDEFVNFVPHAPHDDNINDDGKAGDFSGEDDEENVEEEQGFKVGRKQKRREPNLELGRSIEPNFSPRKKEKSIHKYEDEEKDEEVELPVPVNPLNFEEDLKEEEGIIDNDIIHDLRFVSPIKPVSHENTRDVSQEKNRNEENSKDFTSKMDEESPKMVNSSTQSIDNETKRAVKKVQKIDKTLVLLLGEIDKMLMKIKQGDKRYIISLHKMIEKMNEDSLI